MLDKLRKLRKKGSSDGPPPAPIHHPQVGHAAPPSSTPAQAQRQVPRSSQATASSSTPGSKMAAPSNNLIALREQNNSASSLIKNVTETKEKIKMENKRLEQAELQLQEARKKYAEVAKPQGSTRPVDPMKLQRAQREVKVCMERVKNRDLSVRNLEQVLQTYEDTLQQKEKVSDMKEFASNMQTHKVTEEEVNKQVDDFNDILDASRDAQHALRMMPAGEEVDPEFDEELAEQLRLGLSEQEEAVLATDKVADKRYNEDFDKIMGVEQVPASLPAGEEDEDARAMRALKAEMAARSKMPANLA